MLLKSSPIYCTVESVGVINCMGEKKGLLLVSVMLLPLIFLGGRCRVRPPQVSVCTLREGGERTPYHDEEVLVRGIVTADFDHTVLAGFFLTEQVQAGDISSVCGIFIDLGTPADLVSAGDQVQVRGVAVEVDDESRIRLEPGNLQVLSFDHSPPPSLAVPSRALRFLPNWEPWEGLILDLPALQVVSKGEESGKIWVTDAEHPSFCLQEADPDPCRGLLQLHSTAVQDPFRKSAPGDVLKDVRGVLRQSSDGYYVVLLEEVPFRVLAQVSEELSTSEGDLQPVRLVGTATGRVEPTQTATITITPVPVRLLISEIMPNPEAKEPEGEWIEIFNPVSWTIPLTGVKVGDEVSPAGKEGMLAFPPGFLIRPGDALVVANCAASFQAVYGNLPDFEIFDSHSGVPDMVPYPAWGGSKIQLSNSGDEVVLVNPRDEIIDLVAYGGSTWGAFQPAVEAPGEGHSLERYPPDRDRDQAADWRERQRVSPGKPDRSPPTAAPTPTPTISDTPSLTPIPSATPSPDIPTETPAPVEVLLSEVMINPLGAEPAEEWVEIYNPAEAAMPLSFVKIGDSEGVGDNEGMLHFPAGAYLEPGQLAVIANRADAFQAVFGFTPDYELVDSDPLVEDLLPYPAWGGSRFQLSNQGDEVLLLDGWDQVLDVLCYGSSTYPGPQPPAGKPSQGQSLQRWPLMISGEWTASDDPSPGEFPQPLPSTTPGQSATCSPLPTGTMTPRPTSSAAPTPTASRTGTTAPVPSVTPPPLPSPTVTVTPSATAALTPSATAASPTSTEPFTPTASATAVSTPGPTAPPSATHHPAETATPSPSVQPPTVTTTPEFSPSPGPTETSSSTPDPLLVLNEIHADPHPALGDASGDGSVDFRGDEFIEFVNLSEHALDLSGWTLSDSVTVRYQLPDHTELDAGCPLIIFGGGEPQGEFGGGLVLTAGYLALNNSGDEITLADEFGFPVIRTSYGPEGGQNQSITRSPDLMGPLPLELHSEIPDAAGALFSPGTQLDGNPFPRCGK